MSKIKKSGIASAVIMLILALLVACAPSAQAVQTAIAETQSGWTAIPSQTHYPTYTQPPTPSKVPTVTKSITPTRTPTRSATNTPIPETMTAISIEKTEAKRQQDIVSTEQMKAQILTGTADAISAYATKKAEYVPIDARELLTYANNHIGEKVVISGRIFNIGRNGSVVQIYVTGYDAIYIEMKYPVTGIYEKDQIRIYGIVHGMYCFDNTLGNEICQPALTEAFFEKQ